MMFRKIPFSPPDITEAEIAAVAETLRSGWITTGPRTKEFETLIANHCGTRKAVCLSSASASLEAILRILGIGPGDEVITSAYTYTASCSVICHVGATPVLVDTQCGGYEMDYDALERAITPRTKAVIPVDLAGVVCDYDRIFAAVECKKAIFTPQNDLQKKIGRVAVVADAAHAFGANWHGRPAGAIADFTAFSFHAVKNLTTAEGGALTWTIDTDDDNLYRRFMLHSLHGQSKDALAKTTGSWEYDIITPAYKCNMTDIMAAIGIAQYKRYEGLLQRRKQMIEHYNERLKDYPLQVLDHYGDNHTSSGHLYLVRLLGKDEGYRNEVIARMADRGVATNVHFKPLPLMTAYHNLGFDIKDFPNAFNQFRNEITLPLHTRLSDEDMEYVLENFIDIINK